MSVALTVCAFLTLQRDCHWAAMARVIAELSTIKRFGYRCQSSGMAFGVVISVFCSLSVVVCWTIGPTVTFCLAQSGAVLRRISLHIVHLVWVWFCQSESAGYFVYLCPKLFFFPYFSS
jgi:hypothetical protein